MPDRSDLEPLVRSITAVTGGRALSTQAARVGAMVAQHAGTADAAAAFDVFFARWRTMPAGNRRHAAFAGYLLQLVPVMRKSGPCCTRAQAAELATAALAHQDPEWQAVITGFRALVTLEDASAVLSDPGLLHEVVDDLDSAIRNFPADDRGATVTGFRIARAAARAQHADLQGGEAEIDTAIVELTEARRHLREQPDDQLYLTCHIAGLQASRAHRSGDRDTLARCLREQEVALARLPRHHPGRGSGESWLVIGRLLLGDLTTQPTDTSRSESRGRTVRGTHEPPDQDPYVRASAALDLIRETTGNQSRKDQEVLTRAIDLLHKARAQCSEGDELWVRVTSQLANAHFLQSLSIPWEPKPLGQLAGMGHQIAGHLNQAISLLRPVRQVVEGPAHPIWLATSHILASALRMRSAMLPQFRAAAAARMRKESREVGLAGLPGLAWSVLLQSGTRHAMEAGSRAMEGSCLELALRCIEDGEPADAVRALDSGRALVLHAAQVGTAIPEMLSSLGRDELAEEWRAAGPVPSDAASDTLGRPHPAAALPIATGPGVRLRRTVLEVLSASPYGDRLLSPPSPAEIARALRTLGADALVYLVPGRKRPVSPLDGTASGAALIVGADGALRSVELPHLRRDSPELVAYRTVGGAGRDPRRDAGPATAAQAGGPSGTAARTLDELCHWAWRAVMAPLAGSFPGGGGFFGAEPGTPRIPSVVLVPVGTLGVVPWHAAWRTESWARRHALEELQISYAPSARTLCEVAGRTPVDSGAGGSPALVVGNPTRDLRYAGEEAEAIHRVFYPAGTYLDADTADAAAVFARLPDLRGGVLHLACHARVDPGDRHSARLYLAAGSELAAEELTEGTAPRCEAGLVCLAACWSDVSSRGYDEAYSLATAFLAAGAHTVLGSLWPVPDEATSLLMYMTHHYLRRESLPPGQALRRAQLWMLDPRRRTPPEMPLGLAVRARHIRPDNLAGWAGFTHQGW